MKTNCPSCNRSYDVPAVTGKYICECGQEYRISHDGLISAGVSHPAATHHCPGCKGLANELADIAAVLRTGSSGDTFLGKEVSRWIDTAHAAEQELADLRARLAATIPEAIRIIEGYEDTEPMPMGKQWDDGITRIKAELRALLAETEAKEGSESC